MITLSWVQASSSKKQPGDYLKEMAPMPKINFQVSLVFSAGKAGLLNSFSRAAEQSRC